MAEQELYLLIRLRDEASRQLRQFADNVSMMQGQIRNAGLAFAGFGAAVLGGLGYATKAAIEEEIGIRRLSVAMKNAGLSYEDATRNGLEKWITATQRATGVADEQIRYGLAQMVPIVRDTAKAQEMLTLALDMSAGTGKDMTSSIMLLSYALAGNWGMVQRYVPAIKEAQLETDKWRMLQQMFAGQAEAGANPIDKLKNAVSDLTEKIGALLKKELTDFIDKALEAVEKVEKWIDENPELADQLMNLTMAIGMAALVTGTLTLAVLGLAAALAFAGGPMTLVLGAIFALIAGGIWLVLEWDRIKNHWANIWQVMGGAMQVMLGPLGAGVAEVISWAPAIIDHWSPVKGFWENVWNLMKVATKNAVNAILKSVEAMVNKALNMLETFVNAIIGLMNKIPGVKLSSVDWKVNLPRITDAMMDIYRVERNLAGGAAGHAYKYQTAGGDVESGTPPITDFGNYGDMGRTYVMGDNSITINLNIPEGYIGNGEELRRLIGETAREYFLHLQTRMPGTGIKE